MLFTKQDLRKLLVPLILEQMLAVAIGMADTVMVSACGEAAISGVSLVDNISMLLIGLFSAMATGGAVVVSQYIGMKDREHAEDASNQLFYVILLVSGAIALGCLLFRLPLLRLIFGTIEEDVMDNAASYFLIVLLSYVPLAVYNGAAALLRAQGDSKASFDTSLVMNLLNVAGNALLIYGFQMGVVGAALATLVSRIVGMIYIWLKLGGPACLLPKPHLLPLRWNSNIVRKVLAVGIPNGLENSLFQFGKILLISMVSVFGTASIAANAVGSTMGHIQVILGQSIGLGMITVVGQCVGAGEFEQARHYTHQLMRLAYLLMGSLNIAILIFLDYVLMPFNLQPETMSLARTVVFIHGVGCVFLWPLSFALPNALRAAGDARFTMLVSVSSMMIFRLISGYILSIMFGMGLVGIWVAMQIDWLFRIAMFITRFHGHKWETKALVRRNA